MCITGIPATGKTTLCKMLNYSGIQCASLNEVLKNTGIISDGIVDIDQLRRLELKYDVVESHYSHMIHCKYVIIIKDDENILRKRMEQRGYGNEKINENIEAQRSDIIYYEALDLLPENHIFTVNSSGMDINELYDTVKKLINELLKK
ncbi:adenylate kinase family protein [Acidiplasma sp.]|uniref:adenylate kinase family protein n=1 Tax=Acidiplasma sp. TaxID=1872114 RepID=UPI00338ED5E2